ADCRRARLTVRSARPETGDIRTIRGESMRVILAVAALLVVQGALGHGATRQKVTETVVIDAPVDAVWNRGKDFDALQAWQPAVESSTATDGNNVGSLRTLNLKGGGQIVEILEGYDAAEHKFNYRMKDPGPVPVTNYTSTITVKPGDGGGSLVEW